MGPSPGPEMSRLVEFFASDHPNEAEKSSLVDFLGMRGSGTKRGGTGKRAGLGRRDWEEGGAGEAGVQEHDPARHANGGICPLYIQCREGESNPYVLADRRV
jgi:hypothetical protein